VMCSKLNRRGTEGCVLLWAPPVDVVSGNIPESAPDLRARMMNASTVLQCCGLWQMGDGG
jgi:hypothetical protein